MVITTLLITGFIFAALGWTERVYLIMIIVMSAVVNVSICLAATTSQDLKTGYLVGATPRSQQLAEMIGLIVPSLLIGIVLVLLNKAYTFGSAALPAPQATLISLIASGILDQKLPTVLMVFGIMIGFFLLLIRARVLPFAIGLYLPLEVSTAIFVGGVARAIINRFSKTSEPKDSGILAASGMIAGDAIIGVVIALLTVLGAISLDKKALLGPGFGLLFFLLLTAAFTAFCFKKKK
jgi:putative OPT family oligopeptide transporter